MLDPHEGFILGLIAALMTPRFSPHAYQDTDAIEMNLL
jgi:hypothetical protein